MGAPVDIGALLKPFSVTFLVAEDGVREKHKETRKRGGRGHTSQHHPSKRGSVTTGASTTRPWMVATTTTPVISVSII